MFSQILGCVFDTEFNPSDNTWNAIKVYRDGNVIYIDRGFASEEEAEGVVQTAMAEELANNRRFGVGA